MDNKQLKPCEVNVSSETGRLRAVLLHRPGVEIERMTPLNANAALYSDILNKPIVDEEYRNFSGVLERWTQVYYVQDILEELLKDENVKAKLLSDSLRGCNQKTAKVIAEIAGDDPRKLAQVLIEGCEDPKWDGASEHRYLLKPLYNLFFTRDASSTVYNRVLINSMSFEVRERESLIYEAIFRHFFGVDTLNAMAWNPYARTEGGDVQIASPDTLCIGQGIRTNPWFRNCPWSPSRSSTSTWCSPSWASTSAWRLSPCSRRRDSLQGKTPRSSPSTMARLATRACLTLWMDSPSWDGTSSQ